MHKPKLRDALSQTLGKALNDSLKWTGYEKYVQRNAYRSAYFCYQVGRHLDSIIQCRFPGSPLKWTQVKFDEEDNKISGEWLLDILWCEETRVDPDSQYQCPSKIYAALECESKAKTKEFFEDFAKLVHVRSNIKIYLAGVNQRQSEHTMIDYINRRRNQAADFIDKFGAGSEIEEWYLVFWPSPERGASRSLRDEFDKYPYLNAIHAYTLEHGSFVAI